MAPKIDEAPAKCILRIAISTEGPECDLKELKGGYIVQPVPAASKNIDCVNKYSENGKNQKLRLFNRGKAMSGAPIKTGTNQFPKPPIKTGITKKKIIIKPCAVITALYMCELPLKKKPPSWANSNLINIDNNITTIPEKLTSKRYKVTICL